MHAWLVGRLHTVALLATYGRPPRAEHGTVLGGSVPYGQPWITGLGNATELTTPAAIRIGTLSVAPGTYSLWTVPTTSGATLIISRSVGAGRTRYDSTADVGRVEMQTETLSDPQEPFTLMFRTIHVGPDTVGTKAFTVRDPVTGRSVEHDSLIIHPGGHLELLISWDTFRWTIPVLMQEDVHR